MVFRVLSYSMHITAVGYLIFNLRLSRCCGNKGRALRTQEGIAAPVPRIADDPKDVHRLTEIVRYSLNWQGSDGDWRRDFVWVQEYEENSGRSAGASTLNRKRVYGKQVSRESKCPVELLLNNHANI